MKGSGIMQLFEEVYASNTLEHIMTGKAIARAFRAHIIAHSTLSTILLNAVIDKYGIDISLFKEHYERSLNGETDEELLHDVRTNEATIFLKNKIAEMRKDIENHSRTDKLWILYMDYVEIMKLFVTAERTSDWELHLFSVSKMLNLFAATGHMNYAKCARLYLQEMQGLSETHPWVDGFILVIGRLIGIGIALLR